MVSEAEGKGDSLDSWISSGQAYLANFQSTSRTGNWYSLVEKPGHLIVTDLSHKTKNKLAAKPLTYVENILNCTNWAALQHKLDVEWEENGWSISIGVLY